MSETAHFMEDARKSFRLASTAQGIDQMESYAKMGREYMQLVRTASKAEGTAILPTLWPKIGGTIG
jgi:hypothetical protein